MRVHLIYWLVAGAQFPFVHFQSTLPSFSNFIWCVIRTSISHKSHWVTWLFLYCRVHIVYDCVAHCITPQGKQCSVFWTKSRDFKVYDTKDSKSSPPAVKQATASQSIYLYQFMVDGSTCVYCQKLFHLWQCLTFRLSKNLKMWNYETHQ